ncbi:CASP-like protein [Hordeum vulgare]|nr:CASP-like protein [Hordeum vulgare]
MKHEVAALAATWQSHHVRRIKAGLSATSPEVSDTGSDDTAPALAPLVHFGYTMAQAHVRYNTAMVEGQPMSVRLLHAVDKPSSARWDEDNQDATSSLVDLTSTGDGQGMDSSEDE